RMVVISSAFKAMFVAPGYCEDGARSRPGLQMIESLGLGQLLGEAVELTAKAAVEELRAHLRHEAGEQRRVDALAQLQLLAHLALEHAAQLVAVVVAERLGGGDRGDGDALTRLDRIADA